MSTNNAPNVCKHCGEQIEIKDALVLTCSNCKNSSHINCEILTGEEYQVLANPVKHPNIQWKCINCTMPSAHQLSNIEHLAQLIFKQLEELHSKVDFLCKNNAYSSNSHQPQYQHNLFTSYNNDVHSLQSSEFSQQPLISSQSNTFVNHYAPYWNKYLSPNAHISKIPINVPEGNSSFYSNLDNELPKPNQINENELESIGDKNNTSYSVYVDNELNIPFCESQYVNKQCETNLPTQNLKNIGSNGNAQLETVIEYEDVVIPPFEVPNKEYLLCVLSHIDSPSEFYVHVTDESTSNPVDDISEQLANCYSKTQYPILIPENLNELKNKFYAALYASDNNWYRVRVLEILGNCTLLVQYVDYGNTDFVTLDMLNYLKPELAEVPVLAVGCALSHITPIKNEWTDEQIYYFKSISGYEQEKIVTAYITTRPEVIDYDTIIDVFLWNNDVQIDGLGLDCSKDVLINLWMIQFGIAETSNYDWVEEAEKYSKENNEIVSTDVCAKMPTTSESKPKILTESTSNLPKPSVTTVLSSSSSNVVINGNHSFESECSFETETLNESRTLTDQVLSDNANALYSSLDSKTSESKNKDNIEVFITKALPTNLETTSKSYPLNNLVPGMTVFIKITAIQSPHFFFGVLPFGTMPYENINVDTAKQLMDKLKTAPEFHNYKELSNKMKLHYSKTRPQDQLKVSPPLGSLIAAREDQNIFRAKVIDVDYENNLFQLKCIDTGKISSVSKNNMLILKKEFMELPEFAVQYSMPNIEPFNCNLVNQRKCTWTDQAKKAFIDFTFGNVFLANILEIKKQNNESNEIVSVDLLNIFEEQENVDDFMINNKYAQYIQNRIISEVHEEQLEDKDNNNNDSCQENNKTCKNVEKNSIKVIDQLDKENKQSNLDTN